MAAGNFFVDRTNKNVCFDCVQYTHTPLALQSCGIMRKDLLSKILDNTKIGPNLLKRLRHSACVLYSVYCRCIACNASHR